MNPPHTVTNSNTRGEQAELGPKDNMGTQSHQGRQRDTQTKKSPTLTSHRHSERSEWHESQDARGCTIT